MNVIEREAQRLEMRAKIIKWPLRLKKLAERKDDPLSERQFCIKHEIPVFGFNKIKNQHIEPRPKKVDQIESAFAKEGV